MLLRGEAAPATVTITVVTPVEPEARLTFSQSESDASVQRPVAVTLIDADEVPLKEMWEGETVMLAACGWPPAPPVGSQATSTNANSERATGTRRGRMAGRRTRPPKEEVTREAKLAALTRF